MAAAVHLRGALVLAGHFPALAGVDFDVDAGEVVLIKGPNGAGKTTLLRLCAGLSGISGGEGRVFDLDLKTQRRAIRKLVGMVGHDSHLYDDLTLEENVEFAVSASRRDPSRVKVALDRLELGGKVKNVAAGACSAGQRRRCSLAILVARWPGLWLLDEPHAALDARGRDLLDELIAQASTSGCAVLLASHDHRHCEQLAHRTVTMRGGRLLAKCDEAPSRASVDKAGETLAGETLARHGQALDDPAYGKKWHVA